MKSGWLVSILSVCVAWMCGPAVRAAGPASAPADPSADRLTFLTVQLSSVEESVKAINAALRIAGYKGVVAEDKAQAYDKGNEIMDRNAGGPVPWDKFYGKTAKSFHTPWNDPIRRPRQFDYIYRANAEQAAKARGEVALMGHQIEKLVARRRQLEGEQSALWATIAFESIGTRDIAFQPLYRLQLRSDRSPTTQPAGEGQRALMGAAIQFLRIADRSAAKAAGGVGDHQEATLRDLKETIEKSQAALQESAFEDLQKMQLGVADTQQVKDLLAIPKRMQGLAKNITDAYHLAADGDASGDEGRKQTFRAQLQESLLGFADATGEMDDGITALAARWVIRGEPGTVISIPAAVSTTSPPQTAAGSRSIFDVPAPGAFGERRGRRIDLLALADAQHDAVHGKWKVKSDPAMQENGIESDDAKDAGLEFPYQPPEEYDMIAAFSPRDEKDCVNLIAVQNGHAFQLNVASVNKWGGIDSVRGARAADPRNPTRTEVSFHARKWYTLLLQVRRDRIRAFLNGAPFVDYQTDGSELSLIPKWQLRSPRVVGIQSCQNPTIFSTVQVIELSGPGQVLRGTPPAQPAGEAQGGATPLPDGKWVRRWTERGKGGDQVYAIYDGGRRAKAFTWDLAFTHEADGSLGLPGSHFFMTVSRAPDKVVVREWPTRADYDQRKEPISVGVLDVR